MYRSPGHAGIGINVARDGKVAMADNIFGKIPDVGCGHLEELN